MEKQSRPVVRDAREYSTDYYANQAILDRFEMLSRYCPEVVEGYMTLRQGAFMTPPHGALSLKYKEMLAVAIECSLVIPAVFHARKAIEAGATPHEIAEVVSMCIQLGGMVTYMHSGRDALKAAEERSQEISGKSAPAEAKSKIPLRKASDYIADVWREQWVLDAFDRLSRYCPEVVEGYTILRQGSFAEAPAGMIPRKYKELLAVAIECARVVPAVGHARRAIEVGATPHEVAETVSLCIQLGGMVTYMHSGRHALEAAEDHAKELTAGESPLRPLA